MLSERVVLTPLTSEVIQKSLSKWPRRLLLKSVFVGSGIASKLNLQWGAWTVLSNADGTILAVLKAFNLQGQDEHGVRCLPEISDNVLAGQTGIHLSACTQTLVNCDEIDVCTEEEVNADEESEDFKTSVALALKDTVIVEGGKVLVQHYGKTVCLRISKLQQDLPALMSQVSLSSPVGDTKTSTPLRSNTKDNLKGNLGVVTVETVLNVNRDTANIKSEDQEFFVGGLDFETKTILDAIASCDRSYCGCLLYGPSGGGKSLLAQAVANKLKNEFSMISISGSDVFSKYSGETEAQLKSRFVEASKRSKTIILIDEFDTLASSLSKTDQERRVSASLKVLIDNLSANLMGIQKSKDNKARKTILIATSNRPDSIEPSFRRPGRLDFEVELGVPNSNQRTEIVKAISRKLELKLDSEQADLEEVCRHCHGYVGADLEAVVAHAAQQSDDEKITKSSLLNALKIVKPSAMREVQISVPTVTWNDIGGLDELKLQLKQAVEWPIRHPEVFHKMGVAPPKGVLMYGPPGCSKTMIAKALSNESGLNFVAIKGPELFSKYVGESEQAVRVLFRKARSVAPAIIFFDEIDALGSERGSGSGRVGDRVLAQMLTEMDGIEQLNDVTVVAATNRPDMIDKALMRPGRLDRVVYVPLPDRATRLKIFEIHTKHKPLDADVDLTKYADVTENYSGAEIAAVCNEAALKTLEESLSENLKCSNINDRHFQSGLSSVKPRISPSLIKIYDEFRKK